jgi:hypothetical protein
VAWFGVCVWHVIGLMPACLYVCVVGVECEVCGVVCGGMLVCSEDQLVVCVCVCARARERACVNVWCGANPWLPCVHVLVCGVFLSL